MKPGDPADKTTDAKADGAFQGSHRAGYGDRLARVEEWLRKHPSATLASGEGAVLLEEIDRLRAAIDRVRALHGKRTCRQKCLKCEPECIECGAVYPCPTLRAIDWEDA
jgi:hypothetical protein